VQVHVADLVPIALLVGREAPEAREYLIGRDPLVAGVILQQGKKGGARQVAPQRGMGWLVGPVRVLVVNPEKPGALRHAQPGQRRVGDLAGLALL
jgi:hypothetical protein